jgi:virulence-associated protein VagC
MGTARVFRSGNSQVRLPKQFRVKSKEVEIFRRGNEIVLRKAKGNMVRAFDLLAGLPEDFEIRGRGKDRPQKRLSELLNWLPALTLPEKAGQAYGTMRADLAARGQMIGNNDLWIASHALAAELTLVTDNEKEFRRVRRLKMQNWTE